MPEILTVGFCKAPAHHTIACGEAGFKRGKEGVEAVEACPLICCLLPRVVSGGGDPMESEQLTNNLNRSRKWAASMANRCV